MKRLFIIPAILFLFLINTSCSNSDDSNGTTTPPTDIIITFKADLTPVAGVTSSGSGDATLLLNQTKKTFDIMVEFSGITPTAGHIHGADKAVVIPFPDASIATSPIHVTGAITDAQIVELMANHYYVNLHTAANPGGEISGTLIKGGTTGGGSGGGGGTY